MDFASLMSKEISKAKGPSSKDAKANSKAGEDDKPVTIPQQQQQHQNKYISRREVEAAREAEYRAEQAALEKKRLEKQAEKRKREEDEATERAAREDKQQRLEAESRQRRAEREEKEERARRKRLGLPEKPSAAAREGGEEEDGGDADGAGGHLGDIPDEGLVVKLRELGEPAVLFGEGHAKRLRRYRRLTRTVTAGPIPTTLELVEEADMRVCLPEDVPNLDKAGRRYLFRQLASYFTLVLREWQRSLAEVHGSNKGTAQENSFASKAAVNAMLSSRDNMVPLFRKFESGDAAALPDDIVKPVVEIVRAAQERRYVDANDGYLRLSIGKAAWPIGVTMVGIHERSAREKLHGGDARGHVMGDEVTRKYLQAIKRCLTFAQVRWPPEDIRQLMG